MRLVDEIVAYLSGEQLSINLYLKGILPATSSQWIRPTPCQDAGSFGIPLDPTNCMHLPSRPISHPHNICW